MPLPASPRSPVFGSLANQLSLPSQFSNLFPLRLTQSHSHPSCLQFPLYYPQTFAFPVPNQLSLSFLLSPSRLPYLRVNTVIMRLIISSLPPLSYDLSLRFALPRVSVSLCPRASTADTHTLLSRVAKFTAAPGAR